MSDRALATVETIAAVTPIPDADAIEAVQVRGWTVVAKKGEFQTGDRCVYFEIDAMLPLADDRYAFLGARGRRVVDSIEVHVLRTAKLRGVYSQGLVLPIADFPEVVCRRSDDVTDLLGIAKYEPPIPAELGGAVVGAFPTQFAQKTDAERVQNLNGDAYAFLARHDWYATEKVDGTSVTYINDDGMLRVCGRNWEYAQTTGTMWRLAAEHDILGALKPGQAVQCELFGEGIQGNPLKIKGQRLAAFAMVDNRVPTPRRYWPVAVLAFATPTYDLELPATITDAITQADGIESRITPGRKAEGIVWHSATGTQFSDLGNRSCFKVISNAWLAKQKD